MLDIETLGTRPGSVILSIGAVPFTFEGGPDESRGFHVVLPVQEQLDMGAAIDASTLLWWLKDGRGPVLRTLLNPSSALADVMQGLILLRQFLAADGDAPIWANSPSFDLVLLEDLMRRFSFEVPWRYYRARDVRTWLEACGFSRSSDVLPAPEGAHDALVDAIYQARVVCAAARGKR
jgi:hypothetical protein